MKIKRTQICEQHASWLAINPIIGCANNCRYCFLRPENLNKTKPIQLANPRETINKLLQSKYYNPNIPVAIGTRTDMFGTIKNRNYSERFLNEWEFRKIQNTLIFITKCKIPNSILRKVMKMQKTNFKFIFFLSYSGLDNTIELGINHTDLRNNFKCLKKVGIPVVHYWRPFIPQNSYKEKIEDMLGYVSKYANASIVAGLRMTAKMINQFGFWTELQKMDIDFVKVEQIFPSNAIDNLKKVIPTYKTYPILYATSCAVANSLKIPEYNGVFNTRVCKKSSCTNKQREICSKFHAKHRPTNIEIDKVLEGYRISEARNIDNLKPFLYMNNPAESRYTLKPPSGESLLEVSQRILFFLQKLSANIVPTHRPILIITHGSILRAVNGRLKGIDAQ